MSDPVQSFMMGRRQRMRKSRVIHFRMDPAEWVRVEAAARDAGMTVSAFMRSLTLEGAGVDPFFTEEDQLLWHEIMTDLKSVRASLHLILRSQSNAGDGRTAQEQAVIEDVQRVVAALCVEISFFAHRAVRRRREVS
ncbi:MAG: plasmid mobilization protein [Pseudorhizobium sp.]